MALKRQALVAAATLMVALACLILPSTSVKSQTTGSNLDRSPDEGGTYASGELVVVYEEDSEGRALSSIERSVRSTDDVEVEEELPDLDARVLRFPEIKADASRTSREESLAEVKEEFEESPEVEEVYYNHVRVGFAARTDPRFRQQYGLRKVGFPAAWKRHPRGARVAVVDSGVAVGHPDLRGKVVARYDFHNGNSTVEDLNGHGTHIAGIIAAKTRNGIGVSSGCPKCTIIAAKALDKNLVGYDSDIARAINWSVSRGAKVVNLSLGSDSGSKSIIKQAIDKARRKGVVVVAAGGNYGDNRRVWPAAYNNVLAVSYTNSRDARAPNSSYGGFIDVAAPGINIVSTLPRGYGSRSGSSFSAPHAAALAGVLRGQNRNAGLAIRRIKLTARDLGPRGRDAYYGYGRIDAAKASRR